CSPPMTAAWSASTMVAAPTRRCWPPRSSRWTSCRRCTTTARSSRCRSTSATSAVPIADDHQAGEEYADGHAGHAGPTDTGRGVGEQQYRRHHYPDRGAPGRERHHGRIQGLNRWMRSLGHLLTILRCVTPTACQGRSTLQQPCGDRDHKTWSLAK